MRTLLLLALAGCTAQAAPPVAGGGGAAGGDGSDTTAIHDDVAGEINAIGAITPAVGDKLVAEDANDSWAKGSITIQGILDLAPAATPNYSGPCHSGTLPVIADWTLDTAGDITVLDTDHGISFLGTASASTMLYTKAFAATSAEFGIWQDPTTHQAPSGIVFALADADGTTGHGLWLRSGVWETVTVNLTANTITQTGNSLAAETQGPSYWRVRKVSGTEVRYEVSDNCGQWARVYTTTGIADTSLYDVAVLGWKTVTPSVSDTHTARLFDYETE